MAADHHCWKCAECDAVSEPMALEPGAFWVCTPCADALKAPPAAGQVEAYPGQIDAWRAAARHWRQRAAADLAAARAVLAEVEWKGGIYEPHCAGRCPSCEAEVEWDRTKTPTHAPGCRLAALLQGGTP